MKHVRRHFCDPRLALRRVRARLNPCKRCGHEPIFIESGLDWPIYPFSSFPQFLLWCDECGQEVETSPELQDCLKHLREGDVLVVWKLDRLSRSLSDLLQILEKVDKAGASFKSLTETLDTSGPCGRLMMNMLGAFNQFEREKTQSEIAELFNVDRSTISRMMTEVRSKEQRKAGLL